jgi:hypothetical protein
MTENNAPDWLDKLPPEAKAKLTPEVRQKLQEAMGKMKNNPNIFTMLGTLGGLSKIVKDNGGLKNIQNLGSVIDVQSSSSTTTNTSSTPTLNTPTNPSESERINSTAASPSANQQLEKQRNASPTFNPDVKGDTTRIKLIIVGALIIGGYLVYKYVFDEQLPPELIEFLKELA